ncbi:MAG: peptidoglycan DD-metalloendopeptidase family protein [Candidatus Magnetobacterium sp. LHC-1]|uniref:Peptidoglycan DD-metalloendopeptidase family protein n=1 Tax=Candidatus Magnetobacterium casense TaxID=1455061 RepID=A0ABS6S154_9BACT|nr:peptidoglycan DD-metalloendopeptidase family protein [Candidatus Magnetobacterium casensis]MBV6342138.1 peptidoglycan DD-metalloendopeptidase family protein [Candidatus Magnetobacterium casensis]
MPKTLLAMTLTLLAAVAVYARADNTESKYEDVQKKIQSHREKLETTRKKEGNVVEELERSTRELNKLSSEVKQETAKIKQLNAKITVVKQETSKVEASLTNIKSTLRRRLKILQRYGYDIDKILLLLNTEGFYEMLRLNSYLTKLSVREYKQMLLYKSAAIQYTKKEKELRTMLEQQKKDADSLQESERQLLAKRQERKELLYSIKKEQILYESMLKELEATSARLKEIMERQMKQDIVPDSDFKNLKGQLPWPAAGKLAIPYGAHQDPQFKTPVFRYGIYISTDDESDVKAVYDGKVVFADWFKGLGQVVILNHGTGYHTVYANLSRLSPKVGDTVKRMSVIGNAGESGVLNSSGIYFEVRYKGKPINPLQWLKTER